MTRKHRLRNNRRLKYWYDIKAVSGSHAEVTVSIAGLSLAILLILPIFTINPEPLQENFHISYALLFFFTSLIFGLYASFAYSVVSGDMREEKYRLLAFTGPSVSFGISAPLLFLGFIYVLDVYLRRNHIDLFVLSVTRLFLLATVITSGVFVSRTILEAISLWDSPCEIGPCPLENYSRWILIAIIVIYAISTPLSLLRICSEKPLITKNFSDVSTKVFFVLLSALGFYLPLSYYFLTRHQPKKGSWRKILSFILLALFNVLLVMILWLFT